MEREVSWDARHRGNDEDVPLKQEIFLYPNALPDGQEDGADSSHRGSPPQSRRSSGVGSGGKPNMQPNRPSHSSGSNSGSSNKGSQMSLPKEGSMVNVEKSFALRPKTPPKTGVKWYHVWSAKIVNNKYVVAFMMFLTVYALTGDDFRLLVTDKPADIVFNVLTILCLVFFSLECILSCLGKDDYFPGFFFWLDFISTLTLVLDLTWVSEYIVGDEDDFDRARSGRTARMGAKVGRIVRVIRLIRIVKLYKAYYDSRSQKKKKRRIDPVTGEEIIGGEPGADDEDDWGDQDNTDATTATPQQESHVGKKLSALTTRRVIVLVLTMLLGLPLLRTEPSQQTPASPAYGADDVYEAFLAMEDAGAPRLTYERAMLRYLYYHNWFVGNGDCPRTGPQQGCSNTYFSNVFWVGIASKDATLRLEKATAAQLRPETVASWEVNVSKHDYAYNYGTMPAHAVRTLSSPWTQECTVSKVDNLGFALLADHDGFQVKCPSDVRPMEKAKWNPRQLTLEQYQTWHFAFYFDVRPYIRAESACSIMVTCFVCLVLCVASVLFSKDASELVLEPVETMIAKVNMIRENPLIALKMADNEFKLEEINKAKQAKMDKERILTLVKNIIFCRESNSEVMETAILDRTIIKLGTLLALGFGEAGANIVSHNISNSAGVNAMIEGTKIDCILGNTRIENFSTATEVLQGKVMTFVNQIAEIVHGVIDEFGGAANKNNGETFLLIWRLAKNLEQEQASRMADMSMVAFAKVLGIVHRSPVLASYRGHPGLQQRLGMNNRVNLAFGLHHGWAIEGAVGTEFKIDASYLSPHVSITESVLQATTIYGVSFVASEAVVRMCTKGAASKFRLIDRVVIKGSTFPMCLYSLDLDYMSLQVDEPKPRYYIWNPRQRYRARQLLEAEKNRKMSPEVSICGIFDDSPDVTIMRRRFTEEFLQLFNMGYQNYYEGEWAVARRLLSHTRDLLGIRDGPSMALLRFMEPFRFEAPRGWKGVHEFGGGGVDTMEHPDMSASDMYG